MQLAKLLAICPFRTPQRDLIVVDASLVTLWFHPVNKLPRPPSLKRPRGLRYLDQVITFQIDDCPFFFIDRTYIAALPFS